MSIAELAPKATAAAAAAEIRYKELINQSMSESTRVKCVCKMVLSL
jgi:hypothetical protein